jgi:cystathionine beta-lyase/cystathionine gamma-synthase
LHEELEQAIADLKNTEAALVFSSGYLANLGVISAIVGQRDLILGDEYKIIDFRVDKSQGYDEERVIMRNAEGDTLSYPLDMVMAYSKYGDGGETTNLKKGSTITIFGDAICSVYT